MLRSIIWLWRRINPEIAIGFLIATVLWVGVLGWQAAYAPSEMEKQKCYEASHQGDHKGEECKSLWEKATTDPVAFFTLWLVIFTGGLTMSTVLLWRAGEKQFGLLVETSAAQSRDMQDSIRAAQAAARSAADAAYSERAWMTPDGFDQALGNDTTVDGVTYPEAIGIAPKWKNTGRSPAIKVEIFTTRLMARVDGPVPKFEATPSENNGVVVGPGVVGIGVQQWVYGDDDLGYFRLGALKCFIYSRVVYATIFEPDLPRTSESCFSVEFNGMQHTPDGKLVPRLLYRASGPQNIGT